MGVLGIALVITFLAGINVQTSRLVILSALLAIGAGVAVKCADKKDGNESSKANWKHGVFTALGGVGAMAIIYFLTN